MRHCSRASAVADLSVVSAARHVGEGKDLPSVETKIIDIWGGERGRWSNFC